MDGYTFTARQVCDLTGIGYPSLRDLARRGIIVPSKRVGEGKGNPSLYDIFDLVGVAALEFLRPRTETTGLLREAYSWWHSPEGRGLVARVREGTANAVVVLDATGQVTLENDVSVIELARRRKTGLLHVIEPTTFLKQIFHDVGLRRMTGDHAQPGPSGRVPRERTKKAIKPNMKKKRLALPDEAAARPDRRTKTADRTRRDT